MLFRSEDEDDLYEVYDSEGDRRLVCYSCRESGYTRCDRCGEYHADSVMEEVDGKDVCPDCLSEYYVRCEDCGEYCDTDEAYSVIDQHGYEVWVCDYCRHQHYETCDHCGELVHEDLMCDAVNADGEDVRVCVDCYESCNYAQYETTDEGIDVEEAV